MLLSKCTRLCARSSRPSRASPVSLKPIVRKYTRTTQDDFAAVLTNETNLDEKDEEVELETQKVPKSLKNLTPEEEDKIQERIFNRYDIPMGVETELDDEGNVMDELEEDYPHLYLGDMKIPMEEEALQEDEWVDSVPLRSTFIAIEGLPRYALEEDVVRLVDSVPPKRGLKAVGRFYTQRQEPLADKETDYGNFMFPKRRWIVGFDTAEEAKHVMRTLSQSQKHGLSSVKVYWMREVSYAPDGFPTTNISVRNLPPGNDIWELHRWLVDVPNQGLLVEERRKDGRATVSNFLEEDRSLTLIMRKNKLFQGQPLLMEPAEGY